MSFASYGIHWFRRDLKIAGNPALEMNLTHHKGRVVGLFFFDSKFLGRPDFSHNRFGLFLNTLLALKDEIKNLGGELLVLDSLPHDGFIQIFKTLKSLQRPLPGLVTFNRDYEPFARDRDSKISELLSRDFNIEVATASDHLLFEPHEIEKLTGGPYQVFTPFYKRWCSKLTSSEGRARLQQQAEGLEYLARLKAKKTVTATLGLKWSDLLGKDMSKGFVDALESFIKFNAKKVTVKLPKAGSLAAYETLLNFKARVENYPASRDIPSENGTSHFSVYLKNGSLTTAQAFAVLGSKGKVQPFLRQLVWREFYYHILFHFPHVEKVSFKEKYSGIKWANRKDWFEAWKAGLTGYPIVDAGMRQLLETGWMHNRVRMIVASFLTKDLLIDYRWGEQWFMEALLDGDLAPNNGGWQWAASTGCDPQPYFRIFNPELQSLKFDPEGIYIKKYVPELRELSAKNIHNPPASLRGSRYPLPLVVHADQKPKALKLFRDKRS